MKKIIQLILICFIASSYTVAQNTKKIEIQELNPKTFKEKVWNFDKNKKFLREGNTNYSRFYGDLVSAMQVIKPHLLALSAKFKGKIFIYEIDVDKEPELAQRFNVTAMPTLIFIGTSTSYKTELGYQEYDALEKVMKSHFLIN